MCYSLAVTQQFFKKSASVLVLYHYKTLTIPIIYNHFVILPKECSREILTMSNQSYEMGLVKNIGFNAFSTHHHF